MIPCLVLKLHAPLDASVLSVCVSDDKKILGTEVVVPTLDEGRCAVLATLQSPVWCLGSRYHSKEAAPTLQRYAT